MTNNKENQAMKKHRFIVLSLMALLAVACEKQSDRQPKACFEVDQLTVPEGVAIHFTNCSEDATAYYWEFGDEHVSVDFHASHVYKSPGEYEVRLTVFNKELNDHVSMGITVEENPLPVACFVLPSTSFIVGEEVIFENCSDRADSYLWHFGDGNTSTQEEPVHVYLEPGEMEVTLYAENEFGQDSMTLIISVAGSDVLFFDGFEDYNDFALDFGDWTQIDNDGSPTWGLAATSFPNSGYVGSFIIFNPSQTDPPMDEDERFIPYAGQKYAACFAARDSANDDWLISPEIVLGEAMELSFAAKSYSAAYGPDLFVAQLLDGDEVIWLSPENEPVNPPLSWTLYTYDLSAHAGKTVQLQIGCLSDDSVALFLDDIMLRSTAGKDE